MDPNSSPPTGTIHTQDTVIDLPIVRPTDQTRTLRHQIYMLLILVSAGLMLGRIFAVDNLYDRYSAEGKYVSIPRRVDAEMKALKLQNASPERIASERKRITQILQAEAVRNLRPTHSANDRSRWDTLRALVEPDMRVVDENGHIVWFAIDKVQDQYGWDTIDMVKHRNPPSDETASAHLYSSKPTLLPVLMSVPYFLIYNLSGGHLSLGNESHLLVKILLVLINLIPVVLSWVLLSRLIDRYGQEDWSRIFAMAFVCFGTFVSTFVVTLNNHLPGICFCIISLYAASRIFFEGKRNIKYYIAAGACATLLFTCEMPGLAFTVFLLGLLLLADPLNTLRGYVPAMLLVFAAFFATNYMAHKTVSIAYGNPDWYIYDYQRNGVQRQSHWSNRKGIDAGEESRLTYVIHTTIGHHGVFSLTPVWLLSFVGLGMCLARGKVDIRYVYFAIFVLSLSAIVYLYYVFGRPQGDRNYGGMTCGLRWMFWFMPMWILAMLPCLDRMAKSRFLRGVALTLLLLSCLSVAYPLWNPWTHPWLYDFMHALGWEVIR